MSDNRKEYTVDIGGVQHTMLLTAEDATMRGALEVKIALPPKNKAVKPANKDA